MVLNPLNGHVLVELGSKYKNIVAQSKVYDAKSTGKVVGVADAAEAGHVMGKTVYWQDYKEGSTIVLNGKEYTFVKYSDLQGYENE